MKSIREILEKTEGSVSDIHIAAGSPVMVRVNGALQAHGDGRVSDEELTELMEALLSEKQRERLEEKGELSAVVSMEGAGALRLSACLTDTGYALSLRKLFKEAPAVQDLRVPKAVEKLLFESSGILIVSGRAGSGKTTTTAALINELNQTAARTVISLEPLTEYRQESHRCLIQNRSGLTTAEELKEGIASALKEDADVIVLGEVTEPELLLCALDAAQAGALVIFSMNTPDTVSTLKRIMDFFSPELQPMIRERLSELLLGILSQFLIPASEGRGAVYELLIMDQAIRNLIRESRYTQITAIMQTDRRLGMITFDDFLFEMCLMKRVEKETAIAFSADPTAFSRRFV